ncbi:serine racemase [Boeremia exigua]|uniref:serine racemase n=1 Tax=Boeremia exigua TaxID=749465 RepID=UPI001E8CDEB3|nr:serine racemase [Boeremia exigua]KAH6618446.1 serine racemase [Boeremia exigua]
MNSMDSYPIIEIRAIRKAHSVIREQTYRTPIHKCPEVSQEVQDAVFDTHDASVPKLELYFKCENLQKAGSFKFRGSYHFLSQLTEKELRAGIISYSTGNHAIALTIAANHASQLRGFLIPVQMLMTWNASPAKIDTIQRLGGKVLLHGPTLVECIELAIKIQLETGATLVPQGHPLIALGQGTAMLEFHEQMQELGYGRLDAVIVPSATGALLAGTAVVSHALDPHITVFGSEPVMGGANLATARLQGKRVTVLNGTTIADGLRSPTAQSNWEYVKNPTLVKDVLQVTELEIRRTLTSFAEQMKTVVEPSSAVPLAALLFNTDLHHTLKTMYEGEPLKIGVVLTGGNIGLMDMCDLAEKNNK